MKNKIKDFGDIIKAINSPDMGIDEILKIIMDNVSGLINAKAWSLLLADKERKELVFKEVIGEKSEELFGKRMPMDKGIVGWTIENKKSIIVSNPYEDRRFFKDIDKDTGFTTKNILAVPLISKGEIMGVIEAINKADGQEFNKEDLKAVENYAEHAAIALENAGLIENLQKKVRYLTLISDINKNITSILDLDNLLKKSAQLIQKTFGYYYTAIAIVDRNTAYLKGFSSHKDISPSKKNIEIGDGLVGKVLEDRGKIIINNTEEEREYKEGIKGVLSEMVIPIRKENKFLGIIDIGSPVKYAFSEEEASIIEEVSYQLAIAIENAKLYDRLRLASITDDLTGLFNARYCNEKLPEIVEIWQEKKKVGSLIFMDIDHFKNVNDNYNHLVGSTLLRLVGERIKNTLDDKKIGIRYGGDEYIIVIEDIDIEEAIEFTKEIKTKIFKNPFSIRDKERKIDFRINASFGISSFPEVTENPQELLRLADLAMYYVKSHGRDNIAYMDKNEDIKLLDE